MDISIEFSEIISSLDKDFIKKIIGKMDKTIVAKALKTIDPKISEKLFNNINKEESETIKKLVFELGTIRIEEIETAQKEMISKIKKEQ
jgi:flagellar motor switch protein FliG